MHEMALMPTEPKLDNTYRAFVMWAKARGWGASVYDLMDLNDVLPYDWCEEEWIANLNDNDEQRILSCFEERVRLYEKRMLKWREKHDLINDIRFAQALDQVAAWKKRKEEREERMQQSLQES